MGTDNIVRVNGLAKNVDIAELSNFALEIRESFYLTQVITRFFVFARAVLSR